VFGPIRDVLRGTVGRLTVGTDPGAVEREISGVSGPHPVVHVVAVVADRRRRRVDQTDVTDLQTGVEPVLETAVEGGDGAPAVGLLLAGSHQALLGLLDRVMASRAVGVLGDSVEHLPGDVLDLLDDVDPGAGRGREFVLEGSRQKTFGEKVPLLGGVELDGTVRTVVVRRHQTLGRHERGRTPAQRHDGGHRIGGQLREPRRISLESSCRHPFCHRRQLLRQPHPLVGGDAERRQHEYAYQHTVFHWILHRA
jgi:hypothetical protein